MLFIVRTKVGQIMSQDLTWLDIKHLTADDKYKLLTIPNQTATAQHLCKWFATNTQIVSPLTPKTVYAKWGVDLSMVNGNTFVQMIELKRCPDYLRRAPVDKNQIAEFQREWVKEKGSAAEAKTTAPSEVAPSSEPADKPDSEPVSQIARTLNLASTATPIKKRSDLVNEMIAIFSAFGKLAEQVPEMLKERERELVIVEKKLLDLRHIAELYDNLNAAEGYRYYREHRDALRKRRTLKDEILALTAASQFVGAINPAEISDFVKSINELDERKYHPRAILESEVAGIFQSPKTLDLILGKEKAATA